ncbi:hypothetical protein CTA2_4393 [Colletotrichum tanaceti]|uniref:Uncharacterized protein n=1 Tax=Colletotrichum tanaceti TaxID=1306861 RepID=A0A4U6XBC1_9PEZI|nr:hypothetical protein CTA2_4393 [Colletotrichum tanaceti]TKW52855.1 hypothetical protein CTA1_12580 [Colletotrichum tanaceti]
MYIWLERASFLLGYLDNSSPRFPLLFIMNKYVEAPVFVPSAATRHDTMSTASPEVSSPNQPSFRSYYNESGVSPLPHPIVTPSPFRPTLSLGCTSPRSSMRTNTKPQQQQQQQQPGWSAFMSPNSFEQLYTEKAYLTASLKIQGDREVNLMRRLSVLQEKIDNGLPSDERRRSRKKTALLKSKIMEAAAQKKAILLRLGDIYVELQSRETWVQVQSELYERRHSWWSTDSPRTAYATTPSDVASMIPTPLDTASPMFFPMGCHPSYGTLKTMTPCYESLMQALQDGSPYGSWPEGNVVVGNRADELANRDLRFEYRSQTSLQDGNRDENHQPYFNDINPRGCRRSMSLPSLTCLWPGREKSGDPQLDADESRRF